MATTNIVDKDGNSIAASDATVPSDRHFRNAWTLSGKTITEDLAESKKIFHNESCIFLNGSNICRNSDV